MLKKLILTALLTAFLVPATALAGKIGKLEDREKTHYYALRVFMDDLQEKEFLKLKTAEERDTWLKENSSSKQAVGIKKSFWDQYYGYDQPTRDQMAKGEVKVGWAQEQVLMTWGAPYKRKRLTKRTASRSELFVYRFEVDKKGNVLVWIPGSSATYKAIDMFRQEVYIDDAMVTRVEKKKGWD